MLPLLLHKSAEKIEGKKKKKKKKRQVKTFNKIKEEKKKGLVVKKI